MPIPGIIASSRLAITGAYESIASATGTGSSNTITFSSIPSTYQHLQVRFIIRSGAAVSSTTGMSIYPNTETGSSTTFDRHYFYGDGSAVTASQSINQGEFFLYNAAPRNSMLADTFGVGIIDFHDYASTTKNKTVRMLFGFDDNSGTTQSKLHLESGLWRSTNAITDLRFTVNTSFTTGSTIALYGIKGA